MRLATTNANWGRPTPRGTPRTSTWGALCFYPRALLFQLFQVFSSDLCGDRWKRTYVYIMDLYRRTHAFTCVEVFPIRNRFCICTFIGHAWRSWSRWTIYNSNSRYWPNQNESGKKQIDPTSLRKKQRKRWTSQSNILRAARWISMKYPPITYYWTGLLILNHSYLVGNLTNWKIAETKAVEPLKSWHFCISNFQTS